ncbi:MAG: hypothetical protein R3E50_15665 [Halioglobus sp.]
MRQPQWHRLDVQPQPALRQQEIDIFGNSVLRVDFQGTTGQLCIESEFELDTLPPPPLYPLGTMLPSPHVIAHERGACPHPDVERRLAETLAAEAGHEPLRVSRPPGRYPLQPFQGSRPASDGDARAAHETLARQRRLPRPDRPVSRGLRQAGCPGASSADTRHSPRHPTDNATCTPGRVMLPGLGWRGWDAMHGIRVGDGHVALCAAPTQAGTMPVEGAYSFQQRAQQHPGPPGADQRTATRALIRGLASLRAWRREALQAPGDTFRSSLDLDAAAWRVECL